jgi:hypothetical protein
LVPDKSLLSSSGSVRHIDLRLIPSDASALSDARFGGAVEFSTVVRRQNSMRTENGAIPCRDGCPIQVIPSPSSAKILSRRNARPAYMYTLRIEEHGRFRDATLLRIRQPDRTGGAALPVARERKGVT